MAYMLQFGPRWTCKSHQKVHCHTSSLSYLYEPCNAAKTLTKERYLVS